jgi:hypothetical protein
MVNEARTLSHMGKESGLVAPKCEATISICKFELFKGSKDSILYQSGGCANGGSGHIKNL